MKKAFTLTEILITLAIISFIAVLTMTTTSYNDTLKQQKTIYKYASALKALNIAARNLVDDDNFNPFEKKYDGKEVSSEYESLCKGLVSYINGTDNNCNESNKLSGSYLYATNTSNDYSSLTPNIVAQNGINMYVSDMQTTNGDPAVKFFLVYIDTNVNKKHTIEYNLRKNEFPDVYAFAIVPTGNAIPLGLPEYNRMLLPVRVEYVENSNLNYSPDYSYHEAKHYAWNWYSSSEDFELKENIPFTYNDVIRNYLVNNMSSKLYNGLNETYHDEQIPNCTGDVYDNCALKYVFPKYIK